MPDFCRLAHSGQVCKVRQMHTISEKACTRSAQSVQSMHVFCTKSANQRIFFWGKRPGDMQTWCRKRAHSAHFEQTRCILLTHFFSKVCIWHTFLFSYAKYALGKYADLIHTLCRLVKTLCRLGADYNTTYTSVHLTQCFVIIRKVCT